MYIFRNLTVCKKENVSIFWLPNSNMLPIIDHSATDIGVFGTKSDSINIDSGNNNINPLTSSKIYWKYINN